MTSEEHIQNKFIGTLIGMRHLNYKVTQRAFKLRKMSL